MGYLALRISNRVREARHYTRDIGFCIAQSLRLATTLMQIQHLNNTQNLNNRLRIMSDSYGPNQYCIGYNAYFPITLFILI